jgi:hypothetical protein
MMKENDTLTIKRGMSPLYYLEILQNHKRNSKRFRLEALASAMPNLVKVSEMLELSGLATKVKVKVS